MTTATATATPNTGTYAHVHPEFREVMHASDEARLAFLDEPRWIGYQRAQLALDTLQALMNKPRQPRMRNLLIVGDSNNGKTTLIHALTGFIRPTRGAVKFLGEDIARRDPVSLATAGLARSFQLVNVFPDLTVRSALSVGAAARSNEKSQRREGPRLEGQRLEGKRAIR